MKKLEPLLGINVGKRAHSGILADGHSRARTPQLVAKVAEQVRAGYAERMRKAGSLERLFLRWRIGRDIKRELTKKAPKWALHSHGGIQTLRSASLQEERDDTP